MLSKNKYLIIFLVASLGVLITITASSEKTKYNFIINPPDIRVKEKLAEDLIAREIPFKKGDDDIIWIKSKDSDIVIEILTEIESQFRKKTYFIEFKTLSDAKLYTKKLNLKTIPNNMKEGCCPKYYRIESPIGYSEKAELVYQDFLKNYKVEIDSE